MTTPSLRPVWALPADPPAPGGARRWLLVGTALALAVVPSALLGDDANASTVLAASLSITAPAGLAAAVSLQLQSRSAGDDRLRWAAAGFGAVPVLAVLRAASLKAGGLDVEPVLALLQGLAVPLAVLLGLRVQGSRTPAGIAVVAAPALAAPVVVGALLRDGTATTSLRALELAVAVAATVAVLAWVRQSPAPSRHGHGWVSAGLVLTVLGCVGRALASERTGSAWSAAVVVTDLGVVVPALGLGLVTGRRYRRQLKRWRHLQTQVQAARASSPLLPGLSVSPDEDDGLPGTEQLNRVLAAGRVGIALQPVVAPDGGTLLGAEALARFGGPMPPDRWFRAARRAGTGVALELIALRSALAYQHTLPDDAFLAVNLSPAALVDDDVLVALRGCDLARLVVEVTEQEAVRDYPAARARLEALRTLGARTAVDDTGAGFASLRHVLLLQPDIVKLDQTLTVGIDHDPRQRGLVAALVGLAEEVGVLLIAEGIDNAEQQRALVALRLPAAQGYHLGMPVLQEPLAERPS